MKIWLNPYLFAIPQNPKRANQSVGAQRTADWEYVIDLVITAMNRDEGMKLNPS